MHKVLTLCIIIEHYSPRTKVGQSTSANGEEIAHDTTQLEKWFPLQGERAHSLKFLKTPIRANLSCVGATTFTSLAFLSSVSMTNLSRLVAASFSSLALSSSVSMANLSCLLVTTFSSLKLLSNSLSSPRFHLLRVGRRCYSVVFCFRLILSILKLRLL